MLKARLVAYVLLGGLLCLAVPAAAQPSAYGVVAHGLDAPRAEKVTQLGAGFARISVRWWQIEPQPGMFEWGGLDDYVWSQAAPRDIRLFISLGEPPEWAGGGPDHNRAPSDMARWAALVPNAVVSRYKGYVKHWGVWNEPDSSLFLDSRDAYQTIATEAARAIRAADPDAFVLGPEISEGALDDGWFAQVMTDWGFEIFDIVTIHIYNVQLGDKMDRLVLPWTFGKEVWLTEVGRATLAGNTIQEELQRLYYRSALDAFERRRWWWTKIFFYDLYNWDGGTRFGIVRPDWSNMRAFSAYRDWIAARPSFTAETDTDGDGLPDTWEGPVGLSVTSAAGANGAQGDPDGDGISNLDEHRQGTHPRGLVTRYFAEGASTDLFDTKLALLNLHPTSVGHVLVRWLPPQGPAIVSTISIQPYARATIRAADVLGRHAPAFATVVESDVPLVADRRMQWGGGAGGAHSETAVTAPATQWFFAEGATHSGFALFYLLQNAEDAAAHVQINYLRPAPAPAITRSYTLAPRSRTNIWVNYEDPQLAAADVSAAITSDTPIIAERAQYLGTRGGSFVAGHESAGVTSPAPQWFLAEGATGAFFDLFLLIANPSDSDTQVKTTYLLPDGRTVVKTYPVPARSRYTVWVDFEDAALADTAVSVMAESTNGVPVVVERTMWWPGPSPANWYEAHNSAGLTESGAAWAIADGEQGGADRWETFVLVANTGDRAGRASVTVHFENGARLTRTIDLPPSSRTNVMIASMFPEARDRRFGVLVESLGPDAQPIVVERASYSSGGGATWHRGTNAHATKLR